MNRIRKALNVVNDSSRERGELSEQVAAQLRAERAAAGWTRQEMVQRSGVPLSTYRKLEMGLRVADVMQLGRITSALNIPLVVFMQRVMDRVAAIERGEDHVS